MDELNRDVAHVAADEARKKDYEASRSDRDNETFLRSGYTVSKLSEDADGPTEVEELLGKDNIGDVAVLEDGSIAERECTKYSAEELRAVGCTVSEWTGDNDLAAKRKIIDGMLRSAHAVFFLPDGMVAEHSSGLSSVETDLSKMYGQR